VAFYVTDIDTAVEYMVEKGVRKMPAGPFTLAQGPAAGQTIQYFQTPWGSYIEFISYPDGMAYQVPSVKPLWSPKLNGTGSVVTNVPGLLGIDHIGLTVPNIDVAAAWLEQKLGFINPLTFGPFSDPTGDFMTQLVDVHPRAVVLQIRMLRGDDGPNIELFQYTSPDQDQRFRRNSDWGGHHIAFYVQRIDKGVEYLQTKTQTKLFGPVTLTDGPAAGQSINYFHDPFGTDVELISYPHGMAYEATAPIPLWNPRDNHP
jgi:catechol 2,3-dioxygenase-like lactoylglutathione lyase family enzyme